MTDSLLSPQTEQKANDELCISDSSSDHGVSQKFKTAKEEEKLNSKIYKRRLARPTQPYFNKHEDLDETLFKKHEYYKDLAFLEHPNDLNCWMDSQTIGLCKSDLQGNPMKKLDSMFMDHTFLPTEDRT